MIFMQTTATEKFVEVICITCLTACSDSVFFSGNFRILLFDHLSEFFLGLIVSVKPPHVLPAVPSP